MSPATENAFGPNFPLEDQATLEHVLGIRTSDRVLEIGGAANPFPRANVVCDITFASSAQRNGAPAVLRDGVTYVESSAEELPFEDGEFDFVYCTQVLEHVADPQAACREISRVARRGFVEVPSRFGEFLNGNPTHRWLVDREGDALVFSPRTFIDHPFRNFFYGVLMADPAVRRLAEVDYRNLINHQVLFASPLICRVHEAVGDVFDYDDPVQAGHAHYAFARNVLSRGGDPAYTLPDAQEAVRLLPTSACARLLHCVHLARLGRPDEALEALEDLDFPQAHALRGEVGGETAGRSFPVPPEDPMALGAVEGRAQRTRPFVSVIVGGSDPDLCRRSAESALTQDYPKVEVLVSTACSTDALRDAFAGLQMGDRLRLMAQGEGVGLAELLNRGGMAARGDLVAFLLEGDRYQPRHVDRLTDRLLTWGASAVHGDWVCVENGEVTGPDIVADQADTAGASVSTLLARRKTLEEMGGFEPEAGDDAPLRLLLRLAERQLLVHVRDATVESTRTVPAGATSLAGGEAGARLNPEDLLRSLIAAYARETGLRSRILELERRLDHESPGEAGP